MGISGCFSNWLITFVVFVLMYEVSNVQNTEMLDSKTANGYSNPESSITADTHSNLHSEKPATTGGTATGYFNPQSSTTERAYGIYDMENKTASDKIYWITNEIESKSNPSTISQMPVQLPISSATNAYETYEVTLSTSYTNEKVKQQFTSISTTPSISTAPTIVKSRPIHKVIFSVFKSTTEKQLPESMSRNNDSHFPIPSGCNSASTTGLKKQLKECQNKSNKDDFVCLMDNISCKGRCGQNSMIHCACDEYCNLYDKCCPDYKAVCQNTTEKLPAKLNGTVQCWSPMAPYLLVSSCPQGFSEATTFECQNGDISPISINQIHFKNENCLLCNGFHIRNGLKWKLTISYSFNRGVDTFVFEDVHLASVKKNGIYQWLPPNNGFHLYLCSQNIVGDCPETTDTEVKRNCLIHRSPVTVAESGAVTLFSNKFCAECNMKSKNTCISAHINDFVDVLNGPGRFRSLISMTVNRNRTKAILKADAPFRWREMTCDIKNRDLTQLDCQTVKCLAVASMVNKSCSLANPDHCMHFSATLLIKNGLPASCSNNSCLEDLLNISVRQIMNTTEREYTNVRLKNFVIQTNSGQFYINMEIYNSRSSQSKTGGVVRLLELYQSALNSLYLLRGLGGIQVEMKVGQTCTMSIFTYRTFTVDKSPIQAAGAAAPDKISSLMISVWICHLLIVFVTGTETI